jgi:coproporphyrinogen III oxidase-like Fe-S oxidoreductase
MPLIERFVSAGYLVREGERVAFSDEGFFVSNAILSELLN